MNSDQLKEFAANHIFKWYSLVIVLVALYVLNRKYVEYKFTKAYGCKDPKLMPLGFMGFAAIKEIFGHMQHGTILEFFDNTLMEQNAPTMKIYVAGMKIIFTVEPENIKAVLATQFNDFALGSRHAHFSPLLGDGIFTLDSHGWKNSRAMLRPQFSREQISHVRTLEPHVQTLASHIKNNKGQVFDIQDLFFKFTVDTATEILFGQSVYCLRDGTVPQQAPADGFDGRENFNEAFNYTQRMLARRSYSQSFYRVMDSLSFRKSCKTVHGFARYYVDRALAMDADELEKKSQSGYTFLYELVKSTRDPKALQDQLLNIMVAGRDTTAGLLSFTMFELSRHPEIYEKLKKEIFEHFGKGTPEDVENITFESLKKCEYLKWVLNEVLRLYPSVPVNFRDATKDTTLPTGGGPDGKSPIFVGKGTTVAYTVYVTHRMKEHYGEDARIFRPERWESQPKLGWAYVPFNGGPRICLGQQFALTEASYTIVRLIQLFPNLTSAYTGPEIPPKMLHLTLSMLEGVPVVMQ